MTTCLVSHLMALNQQAGLDPERLEFPDETWATTNMTRPRGRSRCGTRLVDNTPDRHSKTTTFVAALRTSSLTAPLELDGAINGASFLAYVRQVLVPTLGRGDVVLMANLSNHKRAGGREAIEAAGTQLLYLPPYSPDFKPIELAFSKFKWLLRTAAERTVEPSGTPGADSSTVSTNTNAEILPTLLIPLQ